jgi:CcmD family protein
MKPILRVVAIVALVIAGAGVTAAAQQPTRQETYVPVDSLPQAEQMPAAPLLVGAYSFVLVVFFGYVISVARRLQTVQKEIERLETDIRKPARG